MLRAIYRSFGGSRSSRTQTAEQQPTTHTYTHDADSDTDVSYTSTTTTPSAPPLPPEHTQPGPQRRRLTRAEAAERLLELLECSICLEELNDPRVLPCHHSFCLPCLQKIHIGDSRVFRCPNCNKEVQLRRDVSELPTDFRANALRECVPEDDGDEVDACKTMDAAAASPAFNTSDTVMGLVTCPVCEDLLTEPRHLHCGHSFCLGCLEFMMPMTGTTIHCPCCSGQTVVEGGVRALPVDMAKSHMMEMFAPPSIPAEDSLYPEQEIFDQPPTPVLPTPQGDTARADRPQDMWSIVLTCLQELRTHLRQVDGALHSLHTLRALCTPLTSLCLICFLGGVVVAGVNWESGLLKLVTSVATWFGPLFLLAGVLMLVFSLSNATVGDVGVHQRQKYGGWIGGIVGAEVFVYYSAATNYGLFCAVSGAVFGCVVICLAVLSSSNNQTRISSRGFIEGLALKTIPFVTLGGLHGVGIIDSILFVPSVCIGAFMGTLVSTQVLAFFSRSNISIKLSKYNAFISLRGALLGNITSAVLLRLLHPRFGLGRCLISGAALGTGIGLIFGDIYQPWLRKLLLMPGDNAIAGAALTDGSGTQRRVILAIGTLAGGVLGFVTTLQIFGVLIGALLGLYTAEQGMDSLRIIFNDVLKLYVHCAVGALVGSCGGFLVALQYNSPLWGPLLGVVIETGILELYMQGQVITEH